MADKTTNLTLEEFAVVKKRPLFEWVFAAVILAAIIGLTCGHLIWAGITADSTGLCAVLLLFFIVALGKNFADVLFINRQLSEANTQIINLIEINNIKTFLGQGQVSVFKNHVYNLYQISVRDTEVSQDNLIALLQTKINARTQLVDISSSLLITIGLIGTIVGLIGSVSGLGNVVDAVGEDSTKLMAGLKTTLGGMSTAFYTTLLGAILGGIALRVLASVVATNSDYLVGHIAELSEVYIVPSLRRSAEVHKVRSRAKAKAKAKVEKVEDRCSEAESLPNNRRSARSESP